MTIQDKHDAKVALEQQLREGFDQLLNLWLADLYRSLTQRGHADLAQLDYRVLSTVFEAQDDELDVSYLDEHTTALATDLKEQLAIHHQGWGVQVQPFWIHVDNEEEAVLCDIQSTSLNDLLSQRLGPMPPIVVSLTIVPDAIKGWMHTGFELDHALQLDLADLQAAVPVIQEWLHGAIAWLKLRSVAA